MNFKLPDFFITGLILSLTAWMSQSCTPEKKKQDAIAPKSSVSIVEAMIVRPREMERKISVSGTLLSNEEIELRSEISGKVTGIYFSEGGNVTKGQLLVKINDRDLQAQYKKLVLQDTLLAKEEFRKKKLLEMNAISREEYDQAFFALHTVRAEAEIVKSQLDKTGIYSPFDGQAGLKNVSEGSFVSPSVIIAVIRQVDPVKLEFSVPERYQEYLKKNHLVSFTVTGSEKRYQATIFAVESGIDPQTRALKVRAVCENPHNRLMPGSFAKVEVVLEKTDSAIAVPSQALIPEMNGQKVFLIKNGKALSVPVEPGIRTEAETEIVSGISSGDTLAITGLLQLRNGMEVDVTIR